MSEIAFNVNTSRPGESNNIGNHTFKNENVAKAKCPYCEVISGFKQLSGAEFSAIHECHMVSLKCEHCNSIASAVIEEEEIFPSTTVDSIDDVPDEVEQYYKEGLRCLSANAPNGATAVFRKLIEAICEEYDVTTIESDDSIYDMIDSLHEGGYITEEHRSSLLAMKDAGNDGVHLNNNDPDISQARNLKKLVDSILTATLVARHRMQKAREEHPNPYETND